MSWRIVQSKTGPRRYYYQSERWYAEVRTVYLGTGPAAEQAAREQEQRHEIRRARKRALADIAAQRKFGEQTWGEIDLLLRAALVAGGCYQHGRSQWRTRRFTMPTDQPFFVDPPP